MSPFATSTLTHQSLELNSTISTLPKFPPKKRFQRSLGSDLTIQCERFFFFFFSSLWVNKWFSRFHDRHFWNRIDPNTMSLQVGKNCCISWRCMDYFWSLVDFCCLDKFVNSQTHLSYIFFLWIWNPGFGVKSHESQISEKGIKGRSSHQLLWGIYSSDF